MKTLASNKKAFYDYEVSDTYTGGLELKGWQVKSIKSGNVSLKESYCYIMDGEIFVRNLNISLWPSMGEFEKKQAEKGLADIKILLHKAEIERVAGKLKQKGFTLIPTKLLLDRGWIKIEIGLAKGKKEYDKRRKIREKDRKRDLQRDLSGSKYF
jgi:SsrA-binding protein